MSHNQVLAPKVQVEIIAYAPTEFFHCQHCEAVWGHLDLGQKMHAEERASLLPRDLQAEYQAISDWALAAMERYGPRLQLKLVDAVSIEGVVKSVRHRSRRFPVFVINGKQRVIGFHPRELDGALQQAAEGR